LLLPIGRFEIARCGIRNTGTYKRRPSIGSATTRSDRVHNAVIVSSGCGSALRLACAASASSGKFLQEKNCKAMALSRHDGLSLGLSKPSRQEWPLPATPRTDPYLQ